MRRCDRSWCSAGHIRRRAPDPPVRWFRYGSDMVLCGPRPKEDAKNSRKCRPRRTVNDIDFAASSSFFGGDAQTTAGEDLARRITTKTVGRSVVPSLNQSTHRWIARYGRADLTGKRRVVVGCLRRDHLNPTTEPVHCCSIAPSLDHSIRTRRPDPRTMRRRPWGDRNGSRPDHHWTIRTTVCRHRSVARSPGRSFAGLLDRTIWTRDLI